MSEEQLTDARRRLMDFAARAVAVARTASAATSATAARAAATAHAATTKARATATTAAGRPEAEGPDSSDERDETIARLREEIEAERAKSEERDGAVKASAFKLEILERSYGKQLADARADADAAKQELSELKMLLADTTQELKRVTSIKDRLRDMFAFDGRRVPPELRDQESGDEDTIARLLAMANAMPDPALSREASPPERPPVEQEAGDLLSPELVFDPNDEESEEECAKAVR